MKHLIGPMDLTKQEVDNLLDLADDIIRHPQTYQKSCEGKVLATLFYEPSTRTRLSFESAMLHLGGSALGFASADTSSATKGETVADTIHMVSCYADICAMRHPLEGAPKVASLHSGIPIINAGDGGHQHPTQTLADLLTIRSLRGGLNGITVGLCGDLKYGRTVHSLVMALSRYEGVRFVFISPEELNMPQYIIDDYIVPAGLEYEWNPSLESAIGGLDVLYMTRVQQERFADREQYERLRDVYVLDCAKMQLAPPDMIVLHPLPRVNEISAEVDADPRAKYFEQARYGRYARMALILSFLNRAQDLADTPHEQVENSDVPCRNPRCITTTERGLPPRAVLANGGRKCLYCEQTL